MLPARKRDITDFPVSSAPVVYWMSRDQRVRDNWALLHAQEKALERKQPLIVLFCCVSEYLGATDRQYSFMLEGLRTVEYLLRSLHIPFVVLTGQPDDVIPDFIGRVKAGMLVTDFDPIRQKREWKIAVAGRIHCHTCEVDAHNVVPCWYVSNKQEYAARTLRPKIHRLLETFQDDFTTVVQHPFQLETTFSPVSWQDVAKKLSVNHSNSGKSESSAGEEEGEKRLRQFLTNALPRYSRDRNDPVRDAVSRLSPYLHFGHCAPQRVLLEVQKATVEEETKEAFIEQLLVRRELADNYCYFNDKYDDYRGLPAWARATLDYHRRDRRKAVYSRSQFESGETHDDLWNAIEYELVETGYIHGYLRMYWAKKLLEWSPAPEEAFDTAVYLNNRYELDGRDPNGYVGCAWSIGGLHDRPWPERPVYGNVRSMSRKGMERKLDVAAYIRSVYGESRP